MWTNILWDDVLKDKTILLIEHPVYECLIEKEEYNKEFSKVLQLLNGETMSDYVDFFFTRDVITKTSLIFIGDNEKLDFYDWAVECNCIANLKELHEGESKKEKVQRQKEEQNNRINSV